ncbi:MAG: ABC transporter permease [Kiritimatiellae bacterium]|nr:ABC transporter permease [Kiritimatiellia bacterium]
MKDPAKTSSFEIRQEENRAELRISGSWVADSERSAPGEIFALLTKTAAVSELRITATELQESDMSLPTFVFALHRLCQQDNISLRFDELPEAATRLLGMALAVPEQEGVRRESDESSVLSRIGSDAIAVGRGWHATLEFIGGCCLALGRMAVGRAQFRGSDLWTVVQECGARALPIVSLIGFLMGLILAFVSAMQLKMFGAEIYVANLVGIGIVRVLGAVMTGIVMAGRTGASFAAELGTMQVNEEIDALETLGISPIDFLVLPRLVGLTLMMPLLCAYANFVGLLGGLVVGMSVLDLPARLYINQSMEVLDLTQVAIGLCTSIVFGVLIAMAGCLQGMLCGRSSAAVGTATNTAVVHSITCIVVATAIITVICSVLGI